MTTRTRRTRSSTPATNPINDALAHLRTVYPGLGVLLHSEGLLCIDLGVVRFHVADRGQGLLGVDINGGRGKVFVGKTRGFDAARYLVSMVSDPS